MFSAVSETLLVAAILLVNGCRVIAQECWARRSEQEALSLFGKL